MFHKITKHSNKLSVYLFLIFLVGQIVHVSAQGSQTIAVDPQLINVPMGNQVRLDLEVSNGYRVNSFDLLVNYDAQRLLLAVWELGTFLSNATCTHILDQPGVFELACNQVDRPEVDGNGDLLRLTFNTLEIGNADVTIIEAAFYNINNNVLYPQRRSGRVVVTGDTTFTPTLSPSHTATPTIIPSGTYTITATVEPSSGPSQTAFPTETQMLTPSPSPTAIITSTVTEFAYPSAPSATLVSTPLFTVTPTLTQEPPPTQTAPNEVIPLPTKATELPLDEESLEEPSNAKILFKGLWRVVLWTVLIIVIIAVLGWVVLFLWWRNRIGDDDGLL